MLKRILTSAALLALFALRWLRRRLPRRRRPATR